MATLAQLSDLHLLTNPEERYEGAKPFVNFSRVVNYLFEFQAHLDGIIITGDLAQNITRDTYLLLVKIVKQYQWNIPWYWIAGNHDDKEMAVPILAAANIHYLTASCFVDWQLVAVDSVIVGQTKGYIHAEQLPWLRQQIDSQQRNVLLFQHHHIEPCNSFMDKYIAKVADEYREWLISEDKVKAIFHGHIHSPRQYQFVNKPVYACPATSIEYLHDRKDFQLGKTTPGLNLIHLHKDATVEVEVVWL